MSDQMDRFREEAAENRRIIGVGMDFDAFLQSSVGVYLEQCAQRDIARLHNELETHDFKDADGISRLQMEIALRRVWRDWIQEAIDQGKATAQEAIERGSF